MRTLLRASSRNLSRGKRLPTGRLVIDRAHPLAQGLVACYVPGVMGGQDLVGLGGTLTYDTAVSISVGQEGPGMTGTVAHSGMSAAANSTLASMTACSLYWRGYIIGNSSASVVLLAITPNATNATPFATFMLASGSSGTTSGSGNALQIAWNSAGTFSNTTVGFSGMTAGAVNSIGGTFIVNGTCFAYENGKQVTSKAFGASAPTNTAPQIALGMTPGAATLFTNATGFVGYVWNRQLSASEMAAIDADPYAFLIPAETIMPALLLVPLDPGAFHGGTIFTPRKRMGPTRGLRPTFTTDFPAANTTTVALRAASQALSFGQTAFSSLLLSLRASSPAQATGMAPWSGTTALSARSASTATGRALITGAATLAALSSSRARGALSFAGRTTLLARSSAQAKANALVSVTAALVSLSAASLSAAFGKAAMTVRMPLLARSAAESVGRATVKASALLSALSPSQAKGALTFAGRAVLQALSASQATGRAGISTVSALVALSAASASRMAGKATLFVKVPLAALSNTMPKGRAGIAAIAGLFALSKSTPKGRAGFTGTAVLAARSAAASAGRASASVVSALVALSASTASMAKGTATLLVKMPLLTRSSAQTTGKALTRASLALSALSAGIAKGKAATAMRASLAATSKAISKGRGLLTVISPSVALFARSSSRAVGRVASNIFFPLAPGRLLGEIIARARVLGESSSRSRVLGGPVTFDALGAPAPRVRSIGTAAPRVRIIAAPSRAHGGATMWVQKDFDVSDVGEQEPYGFDYTNILATGEKIASAVWSIAVVSGTDPSPSSHLSGSPTISVSGLVTEQFVVGLLAGCVYRLQALATTTLGNVLSQFAHVTCQTPV